MTVDASATGAAKGNKMATSFEHRPEIENVQCSAGPLRDDTF